MQFPIQLQGRRDRCASCNFTQPCVLECARARNVVRDAFVVRTQSVRERANGPRCDSALGMCTCRGIRVWDVDELTMQCNRVATHKGAPDLHMREKAKESSRISLDVLLV